MRGDSAREVLVPLDGRQSEGLTAPGDGAVNTAFPLLDQFFDRATGEGVRADGAVSTTKVGQSRDARVSASAWKGQIERNRNQVRTT